MTRVSFHVRVTPRSGVDAVDGVGEDGALRVRVRAAPAEGAANNALIRTLAAALDCAPSLVRVDAGKGSRVKRIGVDDMDAAALNALWPGLLTREQ